MPVPTAVIRVRISVFWRTWSRRAFSTLINLPRMGRIAWNFRSRPCFAEPPAESPSTMNNSVFAGSRSEQSASLPGKPPPVSAPLRTVSRALRAASRARAASRPFSMIFLATPGFASKGHQPVINNGRNDAVNFRVHQLHLRLRLEARIRQFHAQHTNQPLADVVAGNRRVFFLQQIVLLRVLV